VVAALLLGLAPRPARATGLERSVHATDAHGPTERLAELGETIAREILRASSPQDLETRLEAQVETGLFADWVQLSMQAMQRDAPPELRRLRTGELSLDDALEEFVLRASAVDQAKVREALRLSLLSGLLGYHLGQHAVATFGEDAILAEAARALDLLFYDVSVPLEVRRALYMAMESALCMTSIAYAVGRDIELSPWLAETLVNRWLEGQRASLRVFLPLARNQGLEIQDFGAVPELEEFDLEAIHAKADMIAEADSIIIQHGARQPTGTWPPPEPTEE
jgi:hypothetical protein